MSDEAALRTYLGEIERAYRAGNATEHTYRPYLKRLLEALAPGATATNEPKREACGAPDYVVTKGSGAAALTVGYVEAKDIGLSLDEVERSEQLGRYRTHLENLLLTDYVEFRWYVKGERHGVKRLASPQAGRLI